MKLYIKIFLNPSITEDTFKILLKSYSFNLIEMKLQHSWTGGSREVLSMLLSTQCTGEKRVESGRFDFIKDDLKSSVKSLCD